MVLRRVSKHDWLKCVVLFLPVFVALPQVAPSTNESLTAAALAAAPPHKQKNMIGERLYPLIYEGQPVLAGKITGKLIGKRWRSTLILFSPDPPSASMALSFISLTLFPLSPSLLRDAFFFAHVYAVETPPRCLARVAFFFVCCRHAPGNGQR